MTNKKSVVVAVSVESCAAGIVSAYESHSEAVSVGSQVAKAIAELFVQAEADGRFEDYFGNGKLGKENKPGELKKAIDAKCAKMTKEKRAGIAKMLKVRLSEARKLHRLEGTPQKGEDIQAALKRYAKSAEKKAKPAEKQAKPEGNASGWSIPENASMDDIADQLSIWVAKHAAASAGLVSKLADFLPVSVRRQRKQA